MTTVDLTVEYLESLNWPWSAEIEYFNGCTTWIWYTALSSSKNRIKRVLAVTSDYPRIPNAL